jgi:hypothetical protein
MTKKSYIKPNLIVHGNVENLTKGNAEGNFTDAVFPTKTPKDDLTFSG